ncbi:MAG: lamin tail domain-containing protein [Colwellia sp.]|nr:lamin tail domain-containing protein [Colwellia sp.]
MLLKWFSRLLHTPILLVLFYFFSSIFTPLVVKASLMPNVFINEIHYDNTGGDIGEYVEIAGDGNVDLTGWSLRLYNGNNGKEYNSFNVDSWSYIDTLTQFGFHKIKTTGLQNGSPDGLVLFDGVDIIQFLSYEGNFTATDGIANGISSTDIGVMEPSNTPIDFSLQLTGKGSRYSDFSWSSPQANTFGTVNTGQEFVISVSEPSNLLLVYLVLISLFLLSKRQCFRFLPDPLTL